MLGVILWVVFWGNVNRGYLAWGCSGAEKVSYIEASVGSLVVKGSEGIGPEMEAKSLFTN
jgi:hypothetical protein